MYIFKLFLVFFRFVNLLASVRRSLDYETISELFNDLFVGVHKLTVAEKIWTIILEVVAIVAELTDADEDELMIQIIANDSRLPAIRVYAETARNLNPKLEVCTNPNFLWW